MNTKKSTGIATLASLAFIAMPALAAQPCCEEEDFQGVGQSPEGVKIQLVEVKRTSPQDIRVVWTLKNTTKSAQVLTKGQGASWSDKYKLAYDAVLIDPDGRLRIKVAKDTKGNLVAAEHHPEMRAHGIVLGAGKTMTTWAKFIAPPSTTKVTVQLPGASLPWENVAVKPE
jgi:hypothetical protein